MNSNSQHDPDSKSASHIAFRRVAIIGAGLSGIVSAVHLLRIGIDVTVFERAEDLGGAWNYSPLPDRDPPFPNVRPPAPDWTRLERLRAEGLSAEEAASYFAPPGPIYANMKSRGSKTATRTSLLNWPEGSGDPLDHGEVLQYLQDIARTYYVEDMIRFRTRMEEVSKTEGDTENWAFDAVVVATGRYSVPRVPDVPGLSDWKGKFPDRVIHAKQYRTPTRFGGKRVLIIGAFISAIEITRELTRSGATVYQSANTTRVGFRDQNENAIKVAMAAKFVTFAHVEDSTVPQQLDGDSPIPGQVILEDGQVLGTIYHVIIATGYLTTFPFLGPILEQPFTPLDEADDRVVTTADGRNVHNLHEDIFYIPDPTLAFIGVTHFANTFSLYDFQAQVLAVVFASRVRLSPEAAMKATQSRRKMRVLPGTLLNSIFLLNDIVIRKFLEWVNRDLVANGFKSLSGPDQDWWNAFKKEREGARPLLGLLQDNSLS
ncbi:FAD dependent oxidoreductase [Lasiosphaeria miniovina]|uniref:FAD dependent oxidoreductase n=1 Tax=Lasiosphaeria miniovina TaxID=1954250 RepID=A0AA39ZPI4_9PEZI|nr:FAD dependent oxidoreductase [Lasiosphaeria miniovina]KAK0701085.1 FAD dependent oxidoreductase [Lasiosphaeria miniovina]